MKLPRWRPVCPECEYSLRGLTGARCPECGEPFPTTQRTFRRWALRRIPWDRRHRSSLLRAYFTTVFLIVFCPWKAARGLVIPDRWGRAVRWAIAHTIASTFILTLLGSTMFHVRWIAQRFWTAPSMSDHVARQERAPALRALVWMGQSFVAWSIVLIGIMILGAALSYGVPRRHRAAKLGGVKWTLYSSALMTTGLVSALLLLSTILAIGSGRSVILTLQTFHVDFGFSPFALLIFHSCWWAAGMCMNPYQSWRREGPFLLWLVGLLAAWLLASRVLFPAGPLMELL